MRLIVLATLLAALLAVGARPTQAASVRDLLRAYPDALSGVEGDTLVWRDGTRMPLGTLRPVPLAEKLRDGTIREMLEMPYPRGAAIVAPGPDDDPGRIRNRAFFDKLYGDCHAGEVSAHLVPVTWLPGAWGHAVPFSSVGGADRALAAVSREIDALPETVRRAAYPSAGTFNCRAIAGTAQTSAHGWGIAIDLNTSYSDYWRWRSGGWVNRMPAEIVAAFERHGFVWGGRWSHYDTMHFEYRPELNPVE